MSLSRSVSLLVDSWWIAGLLDILLKALINLELLEFYWMELLEIGPVHEGVAFILPLNEVSGFFSFHNSQDLC